VKLVYRPSETETSVFAVEGWFCITFHEPRNLRYFPRRGGTVNLFDESRAVSGQHVNRIGALERAFFEPAQDPAARPASDALNQTIGRRVRR
jgi:hypothetical protein